MWWKSQDFMTYGQGIMPWFIWWSIMSGVCYYFYPMFEFGCVPNSNPWHLQALGLRLLFPSTVYSQKHSLAVYLHNYWKFITISYSHNYNYYTWQSCTYRTTNTFALSIWYPTAKFKIPANISGYMAIHIWPHVIASQDVQLIIICKYCALTLEFCLHMHTRYSVRGQLLSKLFTRSYSNLLLRLVLLGLVVLWLLNQQLRSLTTTTSHKCVV